MDIDSWKLTIDDEILGQIQTFMVNYDSPRHVAKTSNGMAHGTVLRLPMQYADVTFGAYASEKRKIDEMEADGYAITCRYKNQRYTGYFEEPISWKTVKPGVYYVGSGKLYIQSSEYANLFRHKVYGFAIKPPDYYTYTGLALLTKMAGTSRLRRNAMSLIEDWEYSNVYQTTHYRLENGIATIGIDYAYDPTTFGIYEYATYLYNDEFWVKPSHYYMVAAPRCVPTIYPSIHHYRHIDPYSGEIIEGTFQNRSIVNEEHTHGSYSIFRTGSNEYGPVAIRYDFRLDFRQQYTPDKLTASGPIYMLDLTEIFGEEYDFSADEDLPFKLGLPQVIPYPDHYAEFIHGPTDIIATMDALAYELPLQLKSLPGYGMGLVLKSGGTVHGRIVNEIDFEHKQYIRRVGIRSYEPEDDERADVLTNGIDTLYAFANEMIYDISDIVDGSIELDAFKPPNNVRPSAMIGYADYDPYWPTESMVEVLWEFSSSDKVLGRGVLGDIRLGQT